LGGTGDGKGFKDRVTMLPSAVVGPLRRHLALVRETHRRDVAEGCGWMRMPYALERKLPQRSQGLDVSVGLPTGSQMAEPEHRRGVITLMSLLSSVQSGRP